MSASFDAICKFFMFLTRGAQVLDKNQERHFMR